MNFENIKNYYERLVCDEIIRQERNSKDEYDDLILEDVACVALNHLPPRYIRHIVDMASHQTILDMQKINDAVQAAVKNAFDVVTKNPHSDR